MNRACLIPVLAALVIAGCSSGDTDGAAAAKPVKAKPGVVITSPRAGSTVKSAEVTLRGTVSPPGPVVVRLGSSSKRVPARSAGGRWTATLTLKRRGDYTIVAETESGAFVDVIGVARK